MQLANMHKQQEYHRTDYIKMHPGNMKHTVVFNQDAQRAASLVDDELKIV